MLSGPETPGGPSGLSKHRIEALTDGVYAVALTLLVLELKLPHEQIRTAPELAGALVHLIPQFIAWLVSFLVLAIFWVASHRVFHWVRHVDGTLLWINLLSLLCASFLPFCSSLVGNFGGAFLSQAVYAVDMALLGLVALWQIGHLERHPELMDPPMPAGHVKAARIRCLGIVASAVLAIAISWADPRFGTAAFALMFLITRMSRRFERAPAPVESPAP